MYLQWFRENLKKAKARGKTQDGLAKVLGINPSQITQMKKGSRAIKADELEKIAKYFEIEAPEVRTSRERFPSPVVFAKMVAAPSVWRERGASVMLSNALIGVVQDPKYAQFEQFAVQIEGTKRFAICIGDASTAGLLPGDMVVVEREINGLVETTLRVIMGTQTDINAEILGAVPEGQDVIHSLKDIKIVGRVIGFFEGV